MVGGNADICCCGQVLTDFGSRTNARNPRLCHVVGHGHGLPEIRPNLSRATAVQAMTGNTLGDENLFPTPGRGVGRYAAFILSCGQRNSGTAPRSAFPTCTAIAR